MEEKRAGGGFLHTTGNTRSVVNILWMFTTPGKVGTILLLSYSCSMTQYNILQLLYLRRLMGRSVG